ncbi:biofilm formation regulator HmsP [Clostridium homopropionicum DSM 5847]|uniref:Biofilm formation regulator HmsP n=1 Tax=Clostridium homopropionicum DSM 5847 TaxID=1121318 RepID=A0A0L6Z969_9CLOT|nr:EAL domain-containing protein [Clostridium homopropionicum]KOA19514.1 biofilm formation regulator HmsP [Clostridium homopropionicum DSM 5847]SFG92605.1 EAL and modified HD-GYP domain-containing signal transduction protein [Clostridium homopropionicum]
MEVFVARQPILDKNNKVIAYELLFRSSMNNSFSNSDGDKATLEVINNSFINIGIDKIVGNKKAFINFTEKILKSDVVDILSPKLIVIEVLENVEPTEEIFNVCKSLKNKGFILALDDFVFNSKYINLLKIADIIKVDFTITKGYERKRIIELVKNKNIKFLAEKVETVEEFKQAVAFGYSYFQGYYFSKPLIVSEKMIPENKLVNLKILRELNKEHFSMDNLINLIKRDIALSYKFLKLINSANFGFKSRITSLNQAAALLGEEEVKRWLYFIVVNTIGEDKPEIITVNTLTRARFSELIFEAIDLKEKAFHGYLTGMLSMMDVILDRPMYEILNELLILPDVKEALLGERVNIYSKILNLVISYEKGQWTKVFSIAKELKLDEKCLPRAYIDAIQWAKEV